MNEVLLVGRLTKKADYMVKNEHVKVSFALAVDKSGKTNFINVIAFGKLAENINKYTAKGSLISIRGHIDTTPYESKKENKKIYPVNIIADSVEFLGKKIEEKEEKEQDKNIDNNKTTETENEVKGLDEMVVDENTGEIKEEVKEEQASISDEDFEDINTDLSFF